MILTPSDTLLLTPSDIQGSVQKWNFHLETLDQFQADPMIIPHDTAYFKGVKRYREGGGELWADCVSEEALVLRVQRFLDLFNTIRTTGYDTTQPIQVTIGPHGEIAVYDGHHRAAIAVKLGLSIPGVIILRHPEWDTLVKAAHVMAGYMYGKKTLYHPIPHAEFRTWEVARDVMVRSSAIRGLESTWTSTTVLDIGACQGGVSFNLVNAGAVVTSAEAATEFVQLGKSLERVFRQGCPPVTWYLGDAWTIVSQGWDWIICLSVLHHELKKHNGLSSFKQRLLDLLQNAKRGVVLELASGYETQMKGTGVPQTQDELGPWLNELTEARWEPFLRGVPQGQQMSGSDARWLWVARK